MEVDMTADFKTFQDGDIVLVEGGDLDKDVKFDTDNVDTTENASRLRFQDLQKFGSGRAMRRLDRAGCPGA
jgi:hypothetical protein